MKKKIITTEPYGVAEMAGVRLESEYGSRPTSVKKLIIHRLIATIESLERQLSAMVGIIAKRDDRIEKLEEEHQRLLCRILNSRGK